MLNQHIYTEDVLQRRREQALRQPATIAMAFARSELRRLAWQEAGAPRHVRFARPALQTTAMPIWF